MLAAVALLALLGRANGQATITVDVNSPLQVIDGFGFSEAFDRAAGIQNLSATLQRQALDYLFSPETGAGLTILRNRIGSNGTGDSIEPTSPGSPNATATYVWDDNDEGQVWFGKAALSYGVTTIYADAWSAPGFMKTDGNDCCGGYLCGTTGHTCASGDWRQAYANYLVEYVKLYASAGIKITHLGFLNEPDYLASYSSMLSGAPEAASFIPILYETVHAAGLGDQITLTCCDAEGWQSQVNITEGLMADGMQEYLGVITAHSYTSWPDSLMPTTLKVWGTEAGDLNDHWETAWYTDGSAYEGLTWAGHIATGILQANLSAYLYWEGAEYNTNASSYLVLVQDSGAVPSGRLWAFAHWSRFVRPGAHRVSTTGSLSSSVQTSAFKNVDGSVAVVFINPGATAAESTAVSFSGFVPVLATIYTTDNSAVLAETPGFVRNGAVSVSIPAYSAVTVKLTGLDLWGWKN